MENKSVFSEESRYDRTSFLGKLCISYVFPVFFRGIRNNGLSLDDIDQCSKRDKVKDNVKRFERNWNLDRTKKNPRLWWTLARTFGSGYTILLLLTFLQEILLKIAEPLFLSVIIRHFSGDKQITYQVASYSAIAVCLCLAMYSWLFQYAGFLRGRMGMRLRVVCCSLIYQKALRLNKASLSQTSVGKIVNLMTNDVNRFDEFCKFQEYLLVGPIQTAIVVYIVWTYLGVSCLIGVAILLLLIPLQLFMGKLFARIRSRTASLTDTRLRFMHEIVSGMRVIKMYCWEKPFVQRVTQSRSAEVNQIGKSNYLKALNMTIYFVATRIIVFSILVTYVLLGHTLTSEAVFVSLTLFNSVRSTMTLLVPKAINTMAELMISCKRIENFLLLDEFQSDQFNEKEEDVKLYLEKFDKNFEINSTKSICKKPFKPARVIVDNICAKWRPNLHAATLNDITARLELGDLLVVIGPVGSGKSSLLMTLLGELPIYSGKILLKGRLSYAGQDSWIFNDSVRNNILFGLEYNQKRFQEVVEVCALTRDLQMLPFGDLTLVGEKGVQLSGGQKARVSLARAVYRQADIYLLDDPLSAVDASVAKHIFDKCILGHLQNKIRILVTHQIQFIQGATKILVMKEGQSLAFGSFDELQHLGINFMSLVTSESDEYQEGEPYSEKKFSEKYKVNYLDTNKAKERKVKEESLKHGSISGQVYMEYIRAASSATMWTVMVVFTILSQLILQGSDYFLSIWTNKNQLEGAEPDENQSDIIIYSVLMGALFFTTVVCSISFFSICIRASKTLHNQIFYRLLRTPLTFFDTTPSGQILNRFSKDMGIVDEILSTTACEVNMRLVFAITILLLQCFVNWYLTVPSLLTLFAIFYVRQLYILSGRDIKRYEAIARSPVYSHLNTTINGLTSVRAFGVQQSFKRQFDVYLNDHSATWFMYLSSSRLYSLLVSYITVIYICIVIVSVMLVEDQFGGTAGLVISSALMIFQDTQWAARLSTEFESQMTSVERIVEYKNLEQEAPSESTEKRKPSLDWPTKGEIQFDNLSLVYGNNEDTPVLRNLNFRIEDKEKIGIVGRTGAGKSSMIAALFRLTEPSGVIWIDGVDIQSIGLDDLRPKISIIPQDPVIYSGTIRYNLDPFNQYSDSSLWDALDQVQLKPLINNLAGQLDSELSESGGNLSVGQRQLICLARAILRRNRILVLDEATANIDHQTDSLIQETIRSQFSDCTVLTIAHRINTIIDLDRVMVLDAGQIVEFDIPYLLLQRQGAFYEMCQKTGPKMYSHLLAVAKSTYQMRFGFPSNPPPKCTILS